jgi:hypothetical protein
LDLNRSFAKLIYEITGSVIKTFLLLLGFSTDKRPFLIKLNEVIERILGKKILILFDQVDLLKPEFKDSIFGEFSYKEIKHFNIVSCFTSNNTSVKETLSKINGETVISMSNCFNPDEFSAFIMNKLPKTESRMKLIYLTNYNPKIYKLIDFNSFDLSDKIQLEQNLYYICQKEYLDKADKFLKGLKAESGDQYEKVVTLFYQIILMKKTLAYEELMAYMPVINLDHFYFCDKEDNLF